MRSRSRGSRPASGKYFECKNYQVERHLCADGLVFDPDKTDAEDPCDHVQNTRHKCEGRPRLQPPQPGDGYCPRQNGVYPSPDPTECDRFYSCLNGVGSSQQCAEGLHFDEKIGTCVWARESNRKGCLKASQRGSEQKQKAPDPTAAESKPGDALPNGFRKVGRPPCFSPPQLLHPLLRVLERRHPQ